MSALAFALVIIAVTTGWQTKQPDEGMAARLFQLLIFTQPLVILAFLATANWKRPTRVAGWVTPHAIAAALALGTLFPFESRGFWRPRPIAGSGIYSCVTAALILSSGNIGPGSVLRGKSSADRHRYGAACRVHACVRMALGPGGSGLQCPSPAQRSPPPARQGKDRRHSPVSVISMPIERRLITVSTSLETCACGAGSPAAAARSSHRSRST